MVDNFGNYYTAISISIQCFEHVGAILALEEVAAADYQRDWIVVYSSEVGMAPSNFVIKIMRWFINVPNTKKVIIIATVTALLFAFACHHHTIKARVIRLKLLRRIRCISFYSSIDLPCHSSVLMMISFSSVLALIRVLTKPETMRKA